MIPTRTNLEYNRDHKELRNNKKYYREHIDYEREGSRLYRLANKEAVTARVKECTKRWREANADKLKEKVKCEHCCCTVARSGLRVHQKTKHARQPKL